MGVLLPFLGLALGALLYPHGAIGASDPDHSAIGILVRVRVQSETTPKKLNKLTKKYLLSPHMEKHYSRGIALTSYQWPKSKELSYAKVPCQELQKENFVLSCDIYSYFPYNKSGVGFNPYGSKRLCCEKPKVVSGRTPSSTSSCAAKEISFYKESVDYIDNTDSGESDGGSCRHKIVAVVGDNTAVLSPSNRSPASRDTDLNESRLLESQFGDSDQTLSCNIEEGFCE